MFDGARWDNFLSKFTQSSRAKNSHYDLSAIDSTKIYCGNRVVDEDDEKSWQSGDESVIEGNETRKDPRRPVTSFSRLEKPEEWEETNRERTVRGRRGTDTIFAVEWMLASTRWFIVAGRKSSAVKGYAM